MIIMSTYFHLNTRRKHFPDCFFERLYILIGSPQILFLLKVIYGKSYLWLRIRERTRKKRGKLQKITKLSIATGK